MYSTLIYYLGGIIYDVIVEPPSVGSTTDEHGHTRYSKEKVPGGGEGEVMKTIPFLDLFCLYFYSSPTVYNLSQGRI